MYAVSNLIDGAEPSARAVKEGWELNEGEILVDDLPENPVWNAATQQIRSKGEQEVVAERLAAQTVRASVELAAQSAVGKGMATLTSAERNGLLVVLLHKLGAIGDDGKVRPLDTWA